MIATATRDDLKYSLDGTLGQGVFSTTFQAVEVNSDRPVIIKTLAANLQEYPRFAEFTQQFLALSERLAACQHPSLPGVWEYFEEEGCPYIVYDRIIGQTLTSYVTANGPVASERAIAWLRQIGEALAVLHAANLHHLDIQPGNIVLRQDVDEVVLVDFGLSCDLSPEIRQTHAQLIAPGYAAPERYLPQQPSAPVSDVYALSATLYFLLTGNEPPPAPLLNRIPPDEWQLFPSEVSSVAKVATCRGLAIAPELRPPTIQTWLELLSLPVGVAEHLEAERQNQLDISRRERLAASQQVAEQQARWEAERREAERQEAARLEAERQELNGETRATRKRTRFRSRR
ncbi:MAG: protein kinase, partial [Spirulinaceae cyanobacterium SM2_1_0]|nr:protein kinase [Spirulinaceae cyanobacterium SM2_1_0]